MPGFNQDQINEMFIYHSPTPGQQAKYVELREHFKTLALKIKELVPDSATQTVAIRQLWETSMICNGAIATEGKV